MFEINTNLLEDYFKIKKGQTLTVSANKKQKSPTWFNQKKLNLKIKLFEYRE